ncbi:MAG: hypothetical protein GY861_01015 [bacterium]|nr:hypothetical protein [bacterium]
MSITLTTPHVEETEQIVVSEIVINRNGEITIYAHEMGGDTTFTKTFSFNLPSYANSKIAEAEAYLISSGKVAGSVD